MTTSLRRLLGAAMCLWVVEGGCLPGDSGPDAGNSDRGIVVDSGAADGGAPEDAAQGDAATLDAGSKADAAEASGGGVIVDGGGGADAAVPPSDAGGDSGFPSALEDAGDDDANASDAGLVDAGFLDAGSEPIPAPLLAFSSNRAGEHDVLLLLPDGTELNLTESAWLELFPSFSPDGRHIAFASTQTGSLQLHVADLDTHALSSLASGLASIANPAFSPDGATLVFEGRAVPAGQSDIYRMPVSGGLVEPLTNHAANDASPVFSPNGATLYFVSSRSGAFEVWAMDADGSEERVITSGAGILGKPAISPDGLTLAFARVQGGKNAVVLYDLASETRTTVSAQNDTEPSFSPDGNSVVVTSLRSGNPDLWLLDLDDTEEPRQLTTNGAIDGAAAFAPAPEGP